MGPPIAVKLRCATWKQLATIHRRDLAHAELFLRSQRPPPIGTAVLVELLLPSGSLLQLSGRVREHVEPGGREGRGPGLVLALAQVSAATMWLIESALAAAGESATAEAQPAERGAPADALEDDAPLGAAERDLVTALEEELAAMRGLNPFQTLNVGYGADDDTIRHAFGELARRYHPDRFAKYGSGRVRTIGAEIFLSLRNAYKQLGNAEARAQVLRQLGRSPRAATPPPISVAAPPPIPVAAPPPIPVAAPPPIPVAAPPPVPGRPGSAAEHSFADLFGNPSTESADEAIPIDEIVPPAAAARPSPPLAPGPAGPSAYGAGLDAIESGDYEKAGMLFGVILRKNPGDTQARIGSELAAGLRALAQTDRLEAAQRFEVVLTLDPTHERAARELAAMRRRNTSERTGMLSRLLGKERG